MLRGSLLDRILGTALNDSASVTHKGEGRLVGKEGLQVHMRTNEKHTSGFDSELSVWYFL